MTRKQECFIVEAMAEIISYNSSNPSSSTNNQVPDVNIVRKAIEYVSSANPLTKITFLTVLALIIATPFFVTNRQDIRQRASYEGGAVVLQDGNDVALPIDGKGAVYANSSTIHLKLTSPLGFPQALAGNTSQNGTTVSVYTVSYKVADSQAHLVTAVANPYVIVPTRTPYTFLDKTVGTKSIWVQFIGSNGSVNTQSVQVNLL